MPLRSNRKSDVAPSALDTSSVSTADMQIDDTIPAPEAQPCTLGAVVSSTEQPSAFVLDARFTDVRRIGEGGMGTVFRARDLTLGRDVAIKILKTTNSARKAKLLQEARAQARIDHNNVCRIYEVGETNGEPYMVMQFIDGAPLPRVCDELSLIERVCVVRDVARAVHAAHQLGIVHGDIKPGNILIKRDQDGSITPVLVDFGIAREVEPQGAASSAGPGTPVYMAPELASGLATATPRIDVYALGATLYELLGGRPPYDVETLKLVLVRILTEDPLPLISIVTDIPPALDAIVMKSLARDPARRHATALQLADELDGFVAESKRQPQVLTLPEPQIVVPESSPNFWRNILLAMAFAVVAVSIAIFVERNRMSEASRIDREVVQDAVEMELLMRNAYQLPLHDVERERKQLRVRLDQLRQRPAQYERIDRAAVEYALGRGFLALGEYETALSHLQRAKAEGYAAPELSHVLGKTLLALYDKGSLELRAVKDEASKRRLQEKLDKEYRAAALELLRASLPLRIEAPSHVEAVVAYHEGRYMDAIALAQEAFSKSPLLYEAKQIEGNAHVAMANDLAAKVPTDWQTEHSKHVDAAASAYDTAVEIARSDPSLLDRICYLWTHAMFSASYRGGATRSFFERARISCENAVKADSMNNHARFARADMLVLHAFALANNPEPGENPAAFVDEAIRAAEELASSHFNPEAEKEMLALALRTRVMVTVEYALQDASESTERVIRLYEELLREFPERSAAWNSQLAHAYILQSRQRRWRGIDITPIVDQGLHVLDQSVNTPMATGMMHQKQAMLHMERVAQLTFSDKSPRDAVSHALVAIEAGRETHPDWVGFKQIEAIVLTHQARYETHAGLDPTASIELATKAAEAVAAAAPDDPIHRDVLADVLLVQAAFMIREHRDPTPYLEKARPMLDAAIAAAPWLLGLRVSLARLELYVAQHAASRKSATQSHFDAVRKALGPWLDSERADPEGKTILQETDVLAKSLQLN